MSEETKKNDVSYEPEGKEHWIGKEYSFFQHKKCEFFPCHKTEDIENFNCLFCYCPLYALGEHCGGNYHYMDNGIKDCSKCMVPHRRKNYGYIMMKYGELMELAKKKG